MSRAARLFSPERPVLAEHDPRGIQESKIAPLQFAQGERVLWVKVGGECCAWFSQAERSPRRKVPAGACVVPTGEGLGCDASHGDRDLGSGCVLAEVFDEEGMGAGGQGEVSG